MQVALASGLFFLSSPLLAEGTPAGTPIVNVAQLSWNDGGETRTVQSNAASFTVDERIDVAVAWLDGGSVPVAPGDQNRVLSFRVVNAGNAPEAFALSAHDTIGGDQWDPAITTSRSIPMAMAYLIRVSTRPIGRRRRPAAER